jgi:hypothetical protein
LDAIIYLARKLSSETEIIAWRKPHPNRAKALAESTASKRPGPSGTGATEAAA